MRGAFLKRDKRTATEVERVLELPGPNWTDVRVEFATDETATATVTFIISRDQARRLADALTSIGSDGGPG